MRTIPLCVVLVWLLSAANSQAETRSIGVRVTKDAKANVRVSIHSDVATENRTNITIKAAAPLLRRAEGWGSSVYVGIKAHGVPLNDYLPLLTEIANNTWLELVFVQGKKPDFIQANIKRLIDAKQVDQPTRASTASAEVAKDESTKVTAVVTLPAEVASFRGRTLELRLYEYDPLLADVGADLIEKVTKTDFSHTKGRPTELKIEIGAKGKLKPRRRYYLTTFVLDGQQRTHIGEKDGKRGLGHVISDGHARQVEVVIRPVR